MHCWRSWRRSREEISPADEEGTPGVSKLLDKVKGLLTKHDHSVDKGLNKAGEQADQRTDQRYTGQIDKGVQEARRRTGEGDTTR
jgi:hypothetical protein